MGRLKGETLIGPLIAVFLAAAAYDGYQLLRAAQLNRDLVRIEAGESVETSDPRLQFARAHLLQQRADFEAALEAYAAIAPGDPLEADVKFNLANLYFRRALTLRDEQAEDLAFPLIQLAKQNYVELLRADSGDWDAKYNLELALAIAPETDLAEVEEERNPEHNPHAAAGIQVREPLP